MSEELEKLTFSEGATEIAGFVKSYGDYVLLVKGNSITRHDCTDKIVVNLGWDHEAGMVASLTDKDYVYLFFCYDSEQPFICDSHVVMAEPKLEK